MTTLKELHSESVLRVGDLVEYSPFVGANLTLETDETGSEFPQTYSCPKEHSYVIRNIFEDGSIDIVPQKLEFAVSLGSMTGFSNGDIVLNSICSLYDNTILKATAKSYSWKELQHDTKKINLWDEIRVAFFPSTWKKSGASKEYVIYDGIEYFVDYSMNSKYRFYFSDAGGKKWVDKDSIPFRTATSREPVFVTGSPQRYCNLKNSFKNFWVSGNGVLIDRGEPTIIQHYMCYIDSEGYLSYQFFEPNTLSRSYRIYPIIHIEADAPVDDVYIGYIRDKRICKFPQRV